MKMLRGPYTAWMLSVLAVVILASPAVADTVSFAGSGPGVGVNALAAQADFECTANQLIITLINTSPFPTEIPSELLSGVFFDIDGDPTLTPVSVFLAGGSVVLNGVSDPGGEVSGEWAYRGDIAGGYNGANYGLGVNAVDAFGVGDLFTGTNLDGPASPNGMNYGLVSVGGLGPNVNLPMLSEPLVWNAVVITLNHNGDLSCDDIYNVGFQYGTSATQPFIPGDPGDPPFPPTVIPEPASASLLLMGLAGLALRLRRKQI